jgi:hypothetical protein
MSRVGLYRSITNQSFFIDKYLFNSCYQYPRFKATVLSVSLNNPSKILYSKILLLFHIMTAQKPMVLISHGNHRGVKRKKVVGLLITVRDLDSFFRIFVYRQFCLMPQPYPFHLTQSNLSLSLQYKTQDDDIVFQFLKIQQSIRYEIKCEINTSNLLYLKTLLLNSKIPCLLK